MMIANYINPFNKEFSQATDEFYKLTRWQKVASVVTGIVAGILTPFIACFGSFAAFRWTVEQLKRINDSEILAGEFPLGESKIPSVGFTGSESPISSENTESKGSKIKINCKNAKTFIASSDDKDDIFTNKLLKKDDFKKDAANFVIEFNNYQEIDPKKKVQFFKKKFDEIIKLHSENLEKIPDGARTDSMIAMIIGASESVTHYELKTFKEFFSTEWDFSTYDQELGQKIKSGNTTEYYNWSKMHIAFKGIKFLAKQGRV